MNHGALEFTKITSSKILQKNGEKFKGLLRNQSPTVLNNTSALASFSDNSSCSEKEIALSFQIMTCAEPPELVIDTINSLLAIKSPQDEILIIDNNNQKEHLYQPLADFCNQLNPKLKVRFYHVDKIEGYKAGALNLALELMDVNCSHIVVVDSDYQALPNARESIALAISHYPNHSLLQFPQFYRSSGQNEVHSELNHYFNHHLFRSFNSNKALSTGTYAVIKRSDLIRLGGWSSDSITEDAQMGVKLHRSGLYTQFIPEVISTGLLPNTFKDLMSQRRRWIYGNMQVLSGYFSFAPAATSTNLGNHKLSLVERFGYLRAHLSQLTAWVNFTAPFILLHIVSLFIIVASVIFPTVSAIKSSTVQWLLMTVYCGYGLFALRRLWAYFQDKTPLNKQLNGQHKFNLKARLRTWLMHLNFWEIGAISWLPVLWGQDKPFTCTPKQRLLDSDTNDFIKNLRVAPKLLMLLNLLTAVLVSPLTALYSPYLFLASISFLSIKLGALIVATANFKETEEFNEVKQQDSQDITDKSLVQPQSYINKITDPLVGSRSTYFQVAVKSHQQTKDRATTGLNQLQKQLTNPKLPEFVANSEDFVSKPQKQHLEQRINQ